MSIPVQTDKWAGNLECAFCGRTRLMAEAFSKTMMAKHEGPLKCKECVQKEASKNRSSATSVESNESRVCGKCQKELPASFYNKTQWKKGEGVSRCKPCVELAVAEEAAAVETAREEKITAARQAVDDAKKSGNSMSILKAESVLAALEGEKVTGLRPVKMNHRPRGGGRGRSGRGRSGRR